MALTSSLNCAGLRAPHPRYAAPVRLIQVRAHAFGLEELTRNQVLTSAAFASAIAQVLKPFSSLIAGKGFNWRLIIKSGGMPSSHAAGVVAAATAIGLQRGLSDSLFGLSVVLAGIVVYDAQGVRRAVGKQAEVINTIVLSSSSECKTNRKLLVPVSSERIQAQEQAQAAEDLVCLDVEKSEAQEKLQGPFARPLRFFRKAEMLPSIKEGEVSMQEIGDEDGWRNIPLKESVGHTKVQVAAGAMLGAALTIALSKFS